MDEGSGKRDELDERESTSVLKRGNREDTRERETRGEKGDGR